MRSRKERVEARRKLINLANQLYVKGDSAATLQEKIEASLNAEGIKPETKAFLLEMLKIILPLLLKMFII